MTTLKRVLLSTVLVAMASGCSHRIEERSIYLRPGMSPHEVVIAMDGKPDYKRGIRCPPVQDLPFNAKCQEWIYSVNPLNRYAIGGASLFFAETNGNLALMYWNLY